MKLVYKLTCNPWSDQGAVVLAELLQMQTDLVEDVDVEQGQLSIHFYENVTHEQISNFLAHLLRSRQESLFIPNSLARALASISPNRNLNKTNDDGTKSLDLTIAVSPDEVVRLKERKISIKAGENKIYRLTASYPGMPADLRGIYENASSLAEQVVEEVGDSPPAKASSCAMGDIATKHLAALTQSLHIFANKHHNAAVRGFGGGNGYFKVGATWRYALVMAATETFQPFFEVRDKGTTVLLPIVDDLKFLSRLRRHFEFGGVLHDLRLSSAPTSATNIRDLYKSGTYAGLVSLMHCIRNPLHQNRTPFEVSEVPRLTRWIACQFKRATYVSVGTFHIIDVDENLFKFVQPLIFQRKGHIPIEYTLVKHVLGRMKWPDTGISEVFSRALVESSLSLMKTCLWEMYKSSESFTFYNFKGEAATLLLFNVFFDHFLEVNRNMDIELHNAAKSMGRLVGRAFPKDLTLLSKIYNIHDAAELRDAIKTVLFRLEKMGVDRARRDNVPEHEKLYPMPNKTLETLLSGINPENFRELADVFSIFASLNAFNANVGDKTEIASDTNPPGSIGQKGNGTEGGI